MAAKKVVGVLEWFPAGRSWDKLEQTVEDMRMLGISHLRTGFSWVEYLDSPKWFNDKFEFLKKNNIDVLPCFLYTPPHLSRCTDINCAPEDLSEFGKFVYEAVSKFPQFRYVQLWNEHNGPDWNRNEDPYGELFSSMIKDAAVKIKSRGVKTVLGGMDRFDLWWWDQLAMKGTFRDIDVIGFNSVANMTTKRKYGIPPGWLTEKHPFWEETLKGLKEPVFKAEGSDKPVWITELAYSTTEDEDYLEQGRHLALAYVNPLIGRIYFYGIRDLEPDVVTIRERTSGQRCNLHYHLGAFSLDGKPKLLGDVWLREGIEGVLGRFK